MKVGHLGIAVLTLAALLALATACSSEDSEDSAGDARAGVAESDGAFAVATPGGEAAPSGAPGAPADDGVGAPAADPQLQGLLDRKIIQNTSVDLEVEEVARSFQDIIGIAQAAGGQVASSAFSNEDDEQIADLTLRVPAEQHQDVLARLRGLGTVKVERSDSSDITEEYTDLQARLRTLEATETRYLELLARAQTIEEILLVQDRLDGVRGQIEQVQGRINMLDQLTDLGTIVVHLRPLGGAGGGDLSPVNAAEAAWDASLAALRVVATVGVAVAVFSWWLLLPLGALALGARWWLSRGPGSAAGRTP